MDYQDCWREEIIKTNEEIGGKSTYGLITTQKGQAENVVKDRFVRDGLGTQAEGNTTNVH